MTTIALTSPYNLKTATFAVDTDDYTAAINQVEFTPSTSTSTFTAINGDVVQDVSEPTWVASIGFAQDLAPTGLLRYLLENKGERKDVTFVPKAGGPSVTATLIITPGAIGGSAGADLATATVTLPLIGEPLFVDGI